MAISPNTNFITGQVLTADNANRWPRGIMAYAEKTANTGPFAAETVICTLPSFTAVANRYYRVAGFFPYNETSGAGNAGSFTARIRKGTTTGGTQVQLSQAYSDGNADDSFLFVQWVGTLTAGAQQMVLTFQASANSIVLGGANNPIQLIIEDIGPA